MKTLIFLMACMMYGITCQGQQIELGDAASIKQPPGMTALSENQILSVSKEKFNNNLHLFVSDRSRVYSIENVIVSMSYVKMKKDTSSSHILSNDEYIIQLKEALDAIHRGEDTTIYWSKIEVVNNNKFVVSSGPAHVGRYIMFYGLSRKQYRINANLMFDLSDETKAKRILKDLLSGIKYKD